MTALRSARPTEEQSQGGPVVYALKSGARFRLLPWLLASATVCSWTLSSAASRGEDEPDEDKPLETTDAVLSELQPLVSELRRKHGLSDPTRLPRVQVLDTPTGMAIEIHLGHVDLPSPSWLGSGNVAGIPSWQPLVSSLRGTEWTPTRTSHRWVARFEHLTTGSWIELHPAPARIVLRAPTRSCPLRESDLRVWRQVLERIFAQAERSWTSSEDEEWHPSLPKPSLLTDAAARVWWRVFLDTWWKCEAAAAHILLPSTARPLLDRSPTLQSCTPSDACSEAWATHWPMRFKWLRERFEQRMAALAADLPQSRDGTVVDQEEWDRRLKLMQRFEKEERQFIVWAFLAEWIVPRDHDQRGTLDQALASAREKQSPESERVIRNRVTDGIQGLTGPSGLFGRSAMAPGSSKREQQRDSMQTTHDASVPEELRDLPCPVYTVDSPSIQNARWSQLAGSESVEETVERNISLPLRYPHVLEGITKQTREHAPDDSAATCILFHGPPGCGKTTAARILARELRRPMVALGFESIASMWYGESQKTLDKVLSAVESLPEGAILFVDEADTLFPVRGGGRTPDGGALGGRDDAYDQRLLSQMLKFLEGLQKNSKVVVVFATNRVDVLDPALLSRTTRSVTFPLPDLHAREAIWKLYAKHLPDKEIAILAHQTEGFTGRDIRKVCEGAERSFALSLIRKAKIDEDVGAPPLGYYEESAAERRTEPGQRNVPSPMGQNRL